MDIYEAKAIIEREYNVNERGIITSPGRFESEKWFIPYFYECALNGDGEFTSDEGDEMRIAIDEHERRVIPELANAESIVIGSDSHGFVYGVVAWQRDTDTPIML